MKNNEASVTWRLRCNSTFTKSRNLSFFKDNQSNEERTSPLNDTVVTSARSEKPFINLKDACIFCGYLKHKKLIHQKSKTM